MIRGSHCLFVVLSEFSSIPLVYSRPTRDDADIFRVALKQSNADSDIFVMVRALKTYSPFKLFPFNPGAWSSLEYVQARAAAAGHSERKPGFQDLLFHVAMATESGSLQKEISLPGTSPSVN